MTDHLAELPLFAWKPECKLIPFPMINRIGRIRETAAKLLDKPTDKSAEHYRRQVDKAIRIQLEKIALPEAAIRDQIGGFWHAVGLEAARQHYGWHNTPGGAA